VNLKPVFDALDVDHLGEIDPDQVSGDRHHHEVVPGLLDTLHRAQQFLGEGEIRDWFDQIAECVDLVAVDRELRHVSHEDDDDRRVHLSHQPGGGEAVEVFHLDVQEDDVEAGRVVSD